MHKKNITGRYAELKKIIKSRHEQIITLEDLLSSNEIKKSIAEFIIFTRVNALLISYTVNTTDPHILEALIKAEKTDHIQSLITKITDFPICKTKNWQSEAIKKTVTSLIEDMKLSRHRNDAWALQYFARFFSSHTRNKLFFYANPFFTVKTKTTDHHKPKKSLEQENLSKINAIQFSNRMSPFILLLVGFNFINKSLLPNYFENRTHTFLFHNAISIFMSYFAISRSFMPMIKRSPFAWDAADAGIKIGLEEVVDLEHDKFTISFLIFFTGWISFSELFKLLLPVFNEPIYTYIFNKIAPILISYLATSRLFYPIIQRSPFAWDTAGSAIQMGLMEELDDAIYPPSNIPDQNNRIISQSQAPDHAPQKLRLTCTTDNIFSSIKEETPAPDEYKPKEKRKHQFTTSQCLFSLMSAPRVVKLTWENPAIEPLYGIIEKKNGKLDIDFKHTDGFSRGWSGNSSINARCSNHFFFQSENKVSTQDRIDTQFSRIISLGHVVPPTAHAGLVPIKDDPNFPGAHYKAKSFETDTATSRVGIVPTTRSQSLELVDDSKQELPESLKDKVFYLYEPRSQKKTH